MQSCASLLLSFFLLLPLAARNKEKLSYGEGLIVNIPAPVSEVTQVVEDVVQNGIIRGSKEYNKDEFIGHAVAATSSSAFRPWTEGGQVFYKVRTGAIDPRNFKDSNDVGTVTVRYIVMPQGTANTVLRIDAVYVEEFRHTSHPSDGSVETAECKDIQQRVDAVETMKKQTAEVEQERQAELARKKQLGLGNSATPIAPSASGAAQVSSSREDSTVAASSASPTVVDLSGTPPATTPPASTPQTLQDHIKDLRRQVQRIVKSPGAPLKSAPFHSASTLKSLPPGTEVLVVVSTTYWFGVETHDGQHGWISRDDLELLP